MSKKILHITDLHKRDVDFNSIEGFVSAVTQVQFDIIEFIKQNNIDIVFIGGDWYDKGYRHTGPTLSDNELDRRLSESVNGEVYITLGNHYYLERDNNPESYIIQPCPEHPLLHSVVVPDKPIFKCVDELMVNNVQFSFFHFNKRNKQYWHRRREDAVAHVGIYHDDCVVPTSVRLSAGYYGETSSSYLQNIYDNIDLALINHIHVPIGVTTISLLSGKDVPCIIPGSLGITQNKESEIHKVTYLPVIEVEDDGIISYSLHPFYTHLDMLKFYKKKEKKVTTAEVFNGLESLKSSSVKAYTLKDYMLSKGYDEKHLTLINRSVSGGLDVMTVFNILHPVKEELDVT